MNPPCISPKPLCTKIGHWAGQTETHLSLKYKESEYISSIKTGQTLHQQAFSGSSLLGSKYDDCGMSEFAIIPMSEMRPMDNTPMKAIELTGDIDDQHRLQAHVPEGLPAGPVRLIVLLPDEDEAGGAWAHGVAKDWADELRDPRQDIYTLEDGQPVNAPR